MKKKKNTIVILIITGFLFGLLNTFLYDFGVWEHLGKSIFANNIFLNIFYCLLAIFLVILIHELGHLISFKRQNIDFRGIYVLCFYVVKINGKYKIGLIPEFLKFIGGAVIPESVTIRNEKDEKIVIDKFIRALLAGPNTSIGYAVVVFIMWFIFAFTNLYHFTGFLFYLMIITTLLTLLVVKASKLSAQGLYGDYMAKKGLETDLLFKLNYLIDASSSITEDEESLNYFYPKVVNYLETYDQISNKLYMNLLMHYITRIIFDNQIGCTSIDNKIVRFTNKISKNEEGLILYYHFIYYYYYLNNDLKVQELTEKLDLDSFKVDEKIKNYYKILTEHLLNIKDHKEYLLNPKNDNSSSNSFIYKPLRIESELKSIKR